MHKIGIISDTHGLLRKEVVDSLRGVELILHGGDINKQQILDQLEEIAPVRVVRGNNDKEWAEHIPQTLREQICGVEVLMIHNRKQLPKDLENIDLVVYGHSHKYEDMVKEGIRFLNPGSCGPRRFKQEATLAILTIEDEWKRAGNCAEMLHIEKIVLPNNGRGAEGQSKSGQNVNGTDSEEIPADIGEKIPSIMKDIQAGKTVAQIARKYGISDYLAGEIMRMYLTHPGVDKDGIMRRIGL